MQEDLTILLEWLNANGITELFEEEISPCITEINKQNDKSLSGVANALAKQQKEIRRSNFIYGNYEEIRNFADDVNSIDELIETVNRLENYNNFRKAANNTVIIDGNISSKILIINDFPNDEDDVSGHIFSGSNGKLLAKILESIRIKLPDLCFANLFFWRLPGNRIPIIEELEICKPFVEKMISLVNPELLVFCGNYGVSTLLETNTTISNIRGKILNYSNCYIYHDIKSIAIFGPYLMLKNKPKKKDVWEDLLNFSVIFP